MTKEEWKKAEQALENIYGHVKFIIDGYNVSVSYVKETATKFCLAVYIDGTFKMEWCLNDCDIRRRFCYQARKKYYTKKELEQIRKEVGKREFERHIKKNPEKLYYVYYTPYFGSFRTLKSHLIKHNDSIVLAEVI